VPIGTVLFQRQHDASQGGCPDWNTKLKAGQKLDEASFGFSDSEEQGAQLVDLLLPQKGMITPGNSMGHEGPRRERLPLLPGAKAALTTTALALVTTGHLALQPWQSGDGPFCRSGHQLPSAAAWFACALQ